MRWLSSTIWAAIFFAVTNSQTGVARNLVSDSAGEYVAPNLTPGTYTVRATAMGFQAFERQNITVELGQDARIDCQLTPGQVTQTIQVTESAMILIDGGNSYYVDDIRRAQELARKKIHYIDVGTSGGGMGS